MEIKLPKIIRAEDYHEFEDFSYNLNNIIDRKELINKLIEGDPKFYYKQLKKNDNYLESIDVLELFFHNFSYIGLIYSPLECKKYLDFEKDSKLIFEMFFSCLSENELFDYEENIDEVFDIYKIDIKTKDFIQEYINEQQNKKLLLELEDQLNTSKVSKKRKI